jgi:hypothetical protein
MLFAYGSGAYFLVEHEKKTHSGTINKNKRKNLFINPSKTNIKIHCKK